MKAIIHHAYGPPHEVLRLEDVDTPSIGAADVLVEVHASAVAGDDWRRVRGEPYSSRVHTGLRIPAQRVPGRDVAGRVLAVGAAVTTLGPGDEVFGWCEGAFAERARVPAANLARKPGKLTFAQAAVVPLAGSAALRIVRGAGRVRQHQQVLVIGASGGVGTFVVQIAKAFGASVVGVCSTTNTGLVRSIGADDVVDYTLRDITEHGNRYDVVIDLVGNRSLADLRHTLRRDGTLVLAAGALGQWFRATRRGAAARAVSPFVRQQLLSVARQSCQSDLTALTELIEAQLVTPIVSAHFSLGEVPDALRHFANGHSRGKVAITV